ncbi:MAG: methylenetetrahydrofolate reductase C-terminal domain-containing protein [Planctomycetes bacterium]|nr:methylenetetrahydrofolate reductase C-terminal domain-containing protein [Planctomycetota bacterium]
MPIFTPGRRWQPAYYPFRKTTLSENLFTWLERTVKGPLFGCRMCGNCTLQETAFICAMSCPKGIKNGPCGGSLPERCYVDTSRPCIWYAIYDQAFKMGREEYLLEVLPPLDWEKVGLEQWSGGYKQLKKIGVRKFSGGLISRDAKKRTQAWDSLFVPLRQPDWWQGDSNYHPPAYTEPVSNLERRLKDGEFVVTVELAPPLTVSIKKLTQTIETVKPYVAAINFTDNPSATPRMANIACCALAIQLGADPTMQMAARDRTRVNLQSDAISASAFGVRNIVCFSGDSMRMSPGPRGRMDALDIDAIQMLWILRRMRDEQKYLDGRAIKFPPQYFLGAAASPFASDPRFQALREQKKVNAGAQFFQTNLVFDPDRFDVWLNEIAKRNILDKVYILAGITPIKSVKMARYLNAEVPGVSVPKKLIDRMEAAGDGAEEEGIRIALELIEALRKKQGVHGIHLMPVNWEDITPRIITEAGLLPPDFVIPGKLSASIASPVSQPGMIPAGVRIPSEPAKVFRRE